jgi:hypothetical protein
VATVVAASMLAVSAQGEEMERQGIDGVAPTWERRGRRFMGGLEAARRVGARPAGGGGYLFGARRKKVPWGFRWARCWATRPIGLNAGYENQRGNGMVAGSMGRIEERMEIEF